MVLRNVWALALLALGCGSAAESAGGSGGAAGSESGTGGKLAAMATGGASAGGDASGGASSGGSAIGGSASGGASTGGVAASAGATASGGSVATGGSSAAGGAPVGTGGAGGSIASGGAVGSGGSSSGGKPTDPLACAPLSASPWKIYEVQPGHCLSAGDPSWSGNAVCSEKSPDDGSCSAHCENYLHVRVDLFGTAVRIAVGGTSATVRPIEGSFTSTDPDYAPWCYQMQPGVTP